MGDPLVVQAVRDRITNRAFQAGMEFDPQDLVEHHGAGATYVFLRRVRYAEYDEFGVFMKWRHEDLVWSEYKMPEVEKTGPHTFKVTKFQPRVVFRCPWLAAKVTDAGEVVWDA